MANCVFGDVRKIIESTLQDAEITEMIVLADAEITARKLDSRPANILKTLSMYLTAELLSFNEPTLNQTGGVSLSQSPNRNYRQKAEDLIKSTSGLPIIIANEEVTT
jgi:hypothetical protein